MTTRSRSHTAATEAIIAASAVAYRALTNPYFMEDTARQAESIKDQGVFF